MHTLQNSGFVAAALPRHCQLHELLMHVDCAATSTERISECCSTSSFLNWWELHCRLHSHQVHNPGPTVCCNKWLSFGCSWCRLSVLHAAGRLDLVGNKAARQDITAAKVVVPQAVLSVLDTAIQLHGAAGVGQDTELAGLWGAVRTLRLADGPDEVHLMALGKQVVRQYGQHQVSRSKL
ncbi:MAG: hypothetical protein HC767_15545 [Akkermansiaceae bacterium]|nr:hypothetical protein [Akkermansiaceae bacterium]